VKVQGAFDVVDYYFIIILNCNPKLVWGKMCCKGVAKLKASNVGYESIQCSPTTMGQIPPESLIMVKR
jgi:hypothetical protein